MSITQKILLIIWAFVLFGTMGMISLNFYQMYKFDRLYENLEKCRIAKGKVVFTNEVCVLKDGTILNLK